MREARVIAWELLGEARTPEGTQMTLMRRGHEYMILADGKDLMSNNMKGSEEELARIGFARAKDIEEARVLVGGLGMGFTLRAALDFMPNDATIVVSELMPIVVEWNKGLLAPLTDHAVADKRTEIVQGDVKALLKKSVGGFDAIVLDVDNGPTAFTQASNSGLYDNAGLAMIRAALKPHGVVAVWSAWDDRKFEHRLRHHGFEPETVHVRARLKQGGRRHTIFVGRLPLPSPRKKA